MLVAVVIILGLSFGNTSAASPWDEIRSLIASLQEQVAQLFTRTDNLAIKDTDLQNQIDSIELLPGPPGPEGPQGKSGVSLHLIDGDGQDLGVLIDSGAQGKERIYTTYFPEAGVKLRFHEHYPPDVESFFVTVEPDNNTTLFLSSDCSGTPYAAVSNWPNNLTRVGTSTPPITETPTYYKNTSGAEEDNEFHSLIGSSGVCVSTSSNNFFVPGSTLEEVTLPFAEPVAWPLEIVVQ